MSGPEAEPRIATLTVNPAVDIASTAAAVVPTHKIRTSDERFDPGGGGINVARVMHALGTDALAVIMTGGVTGRLVEELLDEEGVRWRCLPIGGRTRISLNVHDRQSGLEYRFVAEGPDVGHRDDAGAQRAQLGAGTQPVDHHDRGSDEHQREEEHDHAAPGTVPGGRRGRRRVRPAAGSGSGPSRLASRRCPGGGGRWL